MQEVLERLRKAGLTANTEKCIFVTNNIKIFGHLVQYGKISPDEDKIQVVSNLSVPKTKRQLRSFLGVVNFFRSYIPQYSAIAFPLIEMLTKARLDKAQWDAEKQTAFDRLKNVLISKPVLRAPDMTKDYILMIDCSRTHIGCILMQPGDNDDSPGHVISYFKKNVAQRRYATIELELMSIVYGLTKFYHFVYNRPVWVYTDHRPLQWLNSLIKHSSRLARWSLILQHHNITTTYIKVEKQLADALTRMPQT